MLEAAVVPVADQSNSEGLEVEKLRFYPRVAQQAAEERLFLCCDFCPEVIATPENQIE